MRADVWMKNGIFMIHFSSKTAVFGFLFLKSVFLKEKPPAQRSARLFLFFQTIRQLLQFLNRRRLLQDRILKIVHFLEKFLSLVFITAPAQ